MLAANNYGVSLVDIGRFEEARSLLRKTIPAARRVLGESHETMLRMKWTYAEALYKDSGATHENLREAVTTLEEMHQIARRVLGDAHPLTTGIVRTLLRKARPLLRDRETPPSASGGA